MITKQKNLKRKRNPADRASYFTVITQFICTQLQQKSLILNLFPFEFFLNSLKKTSIIFPVRNFWKSLLLQYILSIYLHEKEKNNNPQLLYFSCLLLLYCRSIIHYYTILSFCNKNYSMFYRIRKKKIKKLSISSKPKRAKNVTVLLLLLLHLLLHTTTKLHWKCTIMQKTTIIVCTVMMS